jgi:hypothetical protein
MRRPGDGHIGILAGGGREAEAVEFVIAGGVFSM